MMSRKWTPALAGVIAHAFLSIGLAAPPLTPIQDVLYKADGTPFNGVVTIDWKTFEAADASLIARNRLTRRIVNGLLSIRLVPTTTAGNAAYYSVKYASSGSTSFTEAWAVRPSSQPLRVSDVRIPDPLLGPLTASEAGVGEPIPIDQVSGLRGELDIRPRQGVGFMVDRVAVIASNGELAGAIGSLADCVRVDGTAGPCGTGSGGGTPGFVDPETPAGTVNGSNVTFVLSQAPNPAASLLLYRNGLLQKQSLDYTLSADTIAFASPSVPQPGDILLGSFRTSAATGFSFVDSEVPTGAVNGTNAVFTISLAPNPTGSLLLHRNGLLLKNGLDFTLSGNTVQFLTGAVPQSGDILLAYFRTP